MRLLGTIIIFSCGYFLGRMNALELGNPLERFNENRLRGSKRDQRAEERIDESLMESFPASDAPSFTPPSSTNFH